MFIDGRSISPGTVIDADVAIIGAGAAGITLARELTGSGRTIVLIESGDLEPDDATQALYDGESGAVEYPVAESRLRYFGGTTNHWGGWCRPLMPIDFEGRPGLGLPAWPLTRAELDPYYLRAGRMCQLGSADFDDPAPWAAKGGGTPLDLGGSDIVTRFFIFSPPTRFGEVYRGDIEKAADVATYTNSNVVEIVPNQNATQVERLDIATLAGTRFAIRPKLCILATGGLENPRLLLSSNSVQAAGLGNGNDLVGRYFMEHVTVPNQVAAIALPDESMMPSYYVHSPVIGDANMRAIFMISDAALRRDSRLGISLSIYEAHRPTLSQEAGDTKLEPAIVEMLQGLAATRGRGGMIYGVSCAMEPLPSRDNRVTLSNARDALGMPKLRLTWRPTAKEHGDLAQNIAALARGFGGWQGAVRMMVADSDDWPDPEIGWGNHHMGTTRMAADPKAGVVDADGRVHGLGNLYVAGSSVFPSCGPINPTLTIVALAMRLADHIKAKGTNG